ncbi:hypothetical protein BRCON_2428 [Candidatus Sumerlaea chitinivorans]|uniref:Uncharacterized protein n=1 Tax=Sumerlaea chitinivorans TaxID=2250252 RepID=A0A2Z4Y8Q3_SUMC1|nr:hypothetical protein BRCON_2428 [Candidatus Sumerlaea chitinivorans]
MQAHKKREIVKAAEHVTPSVPPPSFVKLITDSRKAQGE